MRSLSYKELNAPVKDYMKSVLLVNHLSEDLLSDMELSIDGNQICDKEQLLGHVSFEEEAEFVWTIKTSPS